MKAEHLRAQPRPSSTESQQLPLMKWWVSRPHRLSTPPVSFPSSPHSPAITLQVHLVVLLLTPRRLGFCNLHLFPPLSFSNRVLLYALSDLVLTVQLKLASNSYYSCLNLLSAGSTGCIAKLGLLLQVPFSHSI